jgi:hypothetical protein
MRTHTNIGCTGLNADTGPSCQLGWIVSSAPGGGSTVPSPLNDVGDDWMMLRLLYPACAFNSWSSPVAGPFTAIQYGMEYDLKSKRRIEELGEKYYFAITNTGSANLTFSTWHRTLVALP